MVTVQESGGDYSGLAAAIAANETDIDIQGTWSTTDTIASSTLTIDAANPTNIEATGASKHIGRPHDGAETTYRLRNTGSSPLFRTSDDLTLVGLDARHTATSGEFMIAVNGTETITFDSSVLGANTGRDFVFIGGGEVHAVSVTNTMLYAASVAFFVSGSSGSTYTFISSTVFDIVGGASAAILFFNVENPADVTVMRDCLMDVGSGSVIEGVSASTITIDQSKTSAASWADGGSPTITNSTTGSTFTDNVSPGAGDFIICEDVTTLPYDLRLQDSTDNDAQDQHSTAAGRPTVDIIGTSRPQGSLFDLGAFEIVVVPGGGGRGGQRRLRRQARRRGMKTNLVMQMRAKDVETARMMRQLRRRQR